MTVVELLQQQTLKMLSIQQLYAKVARLERELKTATEALSKARNIGGGGEH